MASVNMTPQQRRRVFSQWLIDLRSDRYGQEHGTLCRFRDGGNDMETEQRTVTDVFVRDHGFCCLGVLGSRLVNQGRMKMNFLIGNSYLDYEFMASDAQQFFAALNDTGNFTFDMIADVAEIVIDPATWEANFNPTTARKLLDKLPNVEMLRWPHWIRDHMNVELELSAS